MNQISNLHIHSSVNDIPNGSRQKVGSLTNFVALIAREKDIRPVITRKGCRMWLAKYLVCKERGNNLALYDRLNLSCHVQTCKKYAGVSYLSTSYDGTYLGSFPGPFTIFGLMCEAPHVKISLYNFRAEYVIPLSTTESHCFMRAFKSKCLWTNSSSCK